MDIERVFNIIRKKGTVSKEELVICGVTDEFIKQMIENEILVSVGDKYKIDNVDETVLYGRYLLDIKRINFANTVFICAYLADPTNYSANLQLMYYNLLNDNKENLFKHFGVVYDSLNKNNMSADANFYLFLLGTIYDIPDKYKEAFSELELDSILLDEVDDFSVYENTFRKEIFSNSYFKVNSMVDERFKYDDKNDIPIEDSIEKELSIKWLVKNRKLNKIIYSLLSEDKILELKDLLEREMKKKSLSTTNKYLLKLIDQYLSIQESKTMPLVKYQCNNVFEAIEGNNYSLALDLVTKHKDDYHIEKDSVLIIMIKKILELQKEITPVKVNDGVGNLSLSDKEKQSIMSKVRQLYNGRCAFLLEPMPKEKRNQVHDLLKNEQDIIVYGIGEGEERRLVLRYRPYIKEHINIGELSEDANDYYKKGKYEKACECYEILLKLGRPREITYGMYGLTLIKLHRRKEALDYLKIATIMSKENHGTLDYSEIIESIEYPLDRENRKPKVNIEEDEFTNSKKTSLDDELLNDLIGLTQEGEISLLDACKKLNLSEEDINYIKLIYARDCYYLNHTADGDLYLKQVARSKAKDKRVKDLYKEIELNKKYYPRRLDEDRKQLIIRKK